MLRFEAFKAESPELAAQIDTMQRRELPDGWDAAIPTFDADEAKGMATRKASSKVENAIAEHLPWLIAGSADLTDSTSVRLTFDGAVDLEPGSYAGRQLHFGIREHESAAISNGMSLTKLRPLWSTYLTFSDYARPAIRLSSLMELPIVHVFTHDSIGLGEDGPTHQPVEQIASPARDPRPRRDPPRRRQRGRRGLAPGDRPPPPAGRPDPHPPGRADLRPHQVRERRGRAPRRLRARRPARRRPRGDPDRHRLRGRAGARRARGAEPPPGPARASSRSPAGSSSTARTRPTATRSCRPPIRARVSVEEASTLGWDRWVGPEGAMVGMHTFGSSAPLKDVMNEFGFTPDKVAEAARGAIERAARDRNFELETKKERDMKATQKLHELGQSLWVDNITREMLREGILKGYIDDLSVTGLTSNPSIFEKAIGAGDDYDEQIAEIGGGGRGRGRRRGQRRGERLLRARARRPARRRRPLRRRPQGAPPGSTASSASRSRRCSPTTPSRRSTRPRSSTPRPSATNLFIKIPGTPAGLEAIEESIFAGIPINVTLLFDDQQYLAAADAYMKGIERRIEAGLDPVVQSVASIFMSRWDVAVAEEVPAELKNRSSGSRSAGAPTTPTASCSTRTAGCASPTRAPAPSACSGRAPGPRTRTPPTPSTSAPSPRRSRSTRCPTRRSRPSPTTARSAT